MPAPLVLLHGFAGTGRGWDPVIERLDGERYTPLAPDLRAHGAARDRRPVTIDACVDDVLTAAPPHFALCGYSLGGRVALHVALAAPERVERLVLVSTTAGLADPADRAARVADDEQLALALERDGLGAFSERWLAQPLFTRDPPQAQDRARADIARNDAGALAAALRGLGTGALEPVWDRLGELTCPVTVLVGARDDKFVAIGEQLATSVRDAELGVVAGAGHALPRCAPDAVAAALVPDGPAPEARLRDARAQDAEDLGGIHRRSSLDGPAYREQLLANPEVFGVAPDAIAAGWVRVAADADDLLLGYALARPSDADDEAWDLDGLFVEPRVMGRGVGRALVQDVAGRARGTGAREVSVVANPQASGFYERLGFRAGDEVETRFGPARRMSRPV